VTIFDADANEIGSGNLDEPIPILGMNPGDYIYAKVKAKWQYLTPDSDRDSSAPLALP
jgi:hypothetical protein